MKKKKNNKFVFFVDGFIVFGLILGAIFWWRAIRYSTQTAPQAINLSQYLQTSEQIITKGAQGSSQQISTQEQVLPPELNFAMTFYPQAPFADWSEPWQDACEEASILLVTNTYQNHNWTREQFRDQILNLVAWAGKNSIDFKNATDEQNLEMLQYLGLKGVIHRDPTFEDVQRILDQGHLIIMTFAGKELGNPYYKNGGPAFHAMVIKGYEQGQKIITDDVGTQNGDNYVYSWATLDHALHDYNQSIDTGAKIFIEVLPSSNG